MALLKYDGTAALETAAPTTNFYAGALAQTVSGTSGPDAFWSSGLGDVLTGLGGDDTYYLKSPSDRVVEAPGGGIDKIVAWQNIYLPNYPNVENVKVSGDGLYVAGSAADNIIEGDSGSQQLYGGGGQDVLIGGGGADTFIVIKGEGNDVIQDFSADDRVRLTAGYTSFDQVKAHMSQVGADVKLDLGGADGLMFRNITIDKFTAANFQLQLDPSRLGALTFADEFNGPLSLWDAKYNPTGVWRPDFGYQGPQGLGSYTLVTNNELQIYTSPYFREHPGDFKESPFVSNPDGTLSIWARPSSNSEIFGYHYTSGLITTKPTFAQTYGYFEMRAQLPHAAGAWPAFWLIPADGSWPPELDVMETLTSDPRADYAAWHSNVGGVHTSKGSMTFVPDTADGFHSYGVLWTSTDLAWYVDGVEVFHQATPADMNKPMFMLANMALGGWGGAIAPGALPAQMKIDYIHAYSLAGSSPTPGPSPTPPPPAAPPAAPPSPPPPAASPQGVLLVSRLYGDTLTGGAGNDTLIAGRGPDQLTGAAGADRFEFDVAPNKAGHITDFTPGTDVLDLRGLFASVRYDGDDPIGDGYLKFVSNGAGGTRVLFDPDGDGPAKAFAVTTLDLVAPSRLHDSDWLFH